LTTLRLGDAKVPILAQVPAHAGSHQSREVTPEHRGWQPAKCAPSPNWGNRESKHRAGRRSAATAASAPPVVPARPAGRNRAPAHTAPGCGVGTADRSSQGYGFP
jgi:hypothetical protein